MASLSWFNQFESNCEHNKGNTAIATKYAHVWYEFLSDHELV